MQDALKERGWKSHFNAPYPSQYHCIEEVFALIKKEYKDEIVRNGFSVTNRQHLRIVRESIQKF